MKYNEILRIFSKILKPLLRSYDNIKKQYEELSSFEEVKNAIRYSKNLLGGIEDLQLFMIPPDQEDIQGEL